MNRRNFFGALLGALVAGSALTPGMAEAADSLGLDKYARTIRGQQEAIATWATKDKAATNKCVDALLTQMMLNFDGDTKSSAAMEETRRIFNTRDWSTMSEDGLRDILEVVVPIAVLRYLLSHQRISLDPSKVKSWNAFSDKYQDLILAA